MLVRPRTNPTERVASLDMLRGGLALSVAVYHFLVVTRPFTGPVRDIVVVAGVYAVQTFFIISGFCFFHLYSGAALTWPTWRRFHIKRFFRIAPLYYLAVALSFLLEPPVYPSLKPWRLLENLTLSFGYVHPNHAMVPGGWSIGLEYVFYGALPMLVWLTRPVAALYVLTLLATACAVPSTFDTIAAASEHQRFHLYVAIPNHAFLFLLGGVIADLRRRSSIRLPWFVALIPVGIFGATVVFAQPAFHDHLDVMVGWARVKYVLLSALTVLSFAFVRTPTGRTWRPLTALGDWSYSVYLVHPFAWVLVHHSLPADTQPLWQLVAAVGATLLIAALTYRLIERPLNALGHRLAEQRRLSPQHLNLITDAQRTEAAVH